MDQISIRRVLAIIGLILAVASFAFSGPLIAIAVIVLAVALLV